MRRLLVLATVLVVLAVAVVPMPASAEVEKALIGILGGMQCSL